MSFTKTCFLCDKEKYPGPEGWDWKGCCNCYKCYCEEMDKYDKELWDAGAQDRKEFLNIIYLLLFITVLCIASYIFKF